MQSDLAAQLSASERRLLLGYALAFVLLWAVLPLLVGRTPPNDNLEQLGWSASFEWGYAKHPPLPTWLLIAASGLFPKGLPLTYGLGALQVAAMLLFLHLFARDAFGERAAAVALLLASCIQFYSHRLHFLNHNTLMLSTYAASVWCAWRAIETPAARWWLALGLAWGLGMLAKYQMVVGIAATLVFLAASRERSAGTRIAGVALAGTTAIFVFAPHALWMLRDRFTTVSYAQTWFAEERPATVRVLDVLQFAAEQLGRLLPALIALGLLLWLARRGRRARNEHSPAATQDFLGSGDASAHLRIADRAVDCQTWGPLVAMAALSLVAGLDLGAPWGTAFLWLVPLWLVVRTRAQATLALPLRAAALPVVLAVQALLVAAFR